MSSRKDKKSVAKDSVPGFRSEDEERDFWAEHDVVDFFDWENSIEGPLPGLQPSIQSDEN